uniref:C2 domain-containing protein n=1 Tax=Macrostomum lignano TaxID=282301 RepID=A0A1I8FMA6_9PLAT
MASASQSPNCNAPIGTAVAAAGGPGSSRGVVVAFPSDFKQRERRRASMQDAIDASKINADLYSKLSEGQQHRAGQPLLPRGGLLPNRKTQTTTKFINERPEPEFEEKFIFELKPQRYKLERVGDYRVLDYDPCSMPTSACGQP